MALPVRKGYTGNGIQTTLLSASLNDADTSTIFDVATSTLNWPANNFYIVMDPGTSKEEKMFVTSVSGATITATRGVDDTTKKTHVAGAVVYPVFTASEADEANEISSAMTTKGDLIATNGSTINRLAIGTNTHVLQADSTATNGFKWGQVATAGIADLAVTEGKIADSAVTSAKIANGAIVDADINASAAIALSKLATGALPTAITVNSANISDLSIVDADVSASAAIVDTKLGTIATAGKVSNSATTATNANTANAIVARDGSGNFSAGTVTANLTGNVTGTASGNLVSGGALGTPSSGNLGNCTFPTLNQSTTGQAGSLLNFGRGTVVVTFTNVSAGGRNRMLASFAHSLGGQPSGAAVYNGDHAAMQGNFIVYSVDGTNITVEAIDYGGVFSSITGRIYWMAYR